MTLPPSSFARGSASDPDWERIRVLNERVWEGRVQAPQVMRWLDNFVGAVFSVDRERSLALTLLAQFNYFGERELRELLKSLFRDLFRYPIIQSIRKANQQTTDPVVIEHLFRQELLRTRFLGMGNPSESGSHLLYYFRQENLLPKDLFIHQHEVLTEPRTSRTAEIAIPNLERLVFIDDVLGSGQQAGEYSTKLLDSYKKAAVLSKKSLEVNYYVLFAKPAGLRVARSSLFDSVAAVHTMDDSEMAFDSASRLIPNLANPSDLADLERMARHYGERLFPSHAVGYRNGQMLLGFHHNIPDNSLPIFWTEGLRENWQAIFPRYTKV